MDLLAGPTAQYESLFQTSLHLLFKEVDLGMCCEYYCACVYLTKEYATIYTCISLHAHNGMCFYEYWLVFHSVVISTIKCPCLPYNRTNTEIVLSCNYSYWATQQWCLVQYGVHSCLFQKCDTVHSYHRFRDEAVKSLRHICCMCTVVVTVVRVVGSFNQGCVCVRVRRGRSIKC